MRTNKEGIKVQLLHIRAQDDHPVTLAVHLIVFYVGLKVWGLGA